ncbi:MAG: hypothetical protein ACPG06_07670 [Alphaproteobacteria bacterium]
MMRALLLGAILILSACAAPVEAELRWVYVSDGSIQCEDVPTLSLAEGREKLAKLAGAENIKAMEQRSLMVAQVCGGPGGRVNAYGLTEEGWLALSRGIQGPGDFHLWAE